MNLTMVNVLNLARNSSLIWQIQICNPSKESPERT